jgi:predicted nuclease of predicted toxin-antitoxin system
VKFLVDAQLPAWLARFLNSSGHDAVHTLELPEGNRTTDARIAEIAEIAAIELWSPRIETSETAIC